MTHKNRKKSRIFIFLSTGCSLLRAEGFSCSLGVLYVGLGIGKVQFLIQKNLIFFSAVIFYQFLVIKAWIRIRDPDPESGSAIRENAGSVSGSALNQCGSETLPRCNTYLVCVSVLLKYLSWFIVNSSVPDTAINRPKNKEVPDVNCDVFMTCYLSRLM